ncbi:hypothetical protein TRVA0_002S00364 [Trichomonascus vanleenenianus]|uniref:Tag1p n=1 Tax=Trichomonascus vanleenenianus TaxID=2268995 RepID=UPI003ECB1EE6
MNKGKQKVPDEEREPLLVRGSAPTPAYEAVQPETGAADYSSSSSSGSTSQARSPWRTLCIILLRGFLVVGVTVAIVLLVAKALRLDDLQEELLHAPVLELESVSVAGFSSEGLHLRLSGELSLDYSGVSGAARGAAVRRTARLVRTLQVEEGEMHLYFERDEDEFAKTVTASLPPMEVNITEHVATRFDFVTTLSEFGSPYVLGTIAERLIAAEPLTFKGVAMIGVRKGPLALGPLPIVVEETVNDSARDGGDMSLQVGDITLRQERRTSRIVVTTEVAAQYNFPVDAEVPEISWLISIPACDADDRIVVAQAETSAIHLVPFAVSNVSVTSVVDGLPEELKRPCHEYGERSPLDEFVQNYLDGEDNTVAISGAPEQSDRVPAWLGSILQGIEFKVPLGGNQGGGDLIRDLEFGDFRLELEMAPLRMPRVSAAVRVTIAPPESIHIDQSIDIKVLKARGLADLYSQGEKFAQLNIQEWVPCETFKHGDLYKVQFELDKIPVNVTNESVFSRVMREIVFQGSSAVRVESLTDAVVSVPKPIGSFVLTEIPASGDTNLRNGRL